VNVTNIIEKIPGLGYAAKKVYKACFRRRQRPQPFTDSGSYWEQRYTSGGNSGAGSYGRLAEFKAEVLNAFVEQHGISTVIEFGCGDGNQLGLANYPQYCGVDVSQKAIAHCTELFKDNPTRTFCHISDYQGQKADLAMSLDVIFHLVEDDVFDQYMQTLFAAAEQHIVIYSSNTSDNSSIDVKHVKHRKFTDWIDANASGWKLARHIPNRHPFEGDNENGSFADFYMFEKAAAAATH